MKRLLCYVALVGVTLATPATISAQQTYETAYDTYYYSVVGEHHPTNLVGVRRGICDPYNPAGGVVTYMEWGYQTINEEWVAVGQCPV